MKSQATGLITLLAYSAAMSARAFFVACTLERNGDSSPQQIAV